MAKLIITPAMRAKWKQINKTRKAEGKPALNFPLWVKTRNRIDAIPESYDQDTFVTYSFDSPCGTAACLAGETVICSQRSVKAGVTQLFELDRDTRSQVPIVAGRLLGLEGEFFTRDRETSIFNASASSWPEPYSQRFRYARNNKSRARVAVAYLTHIIRTGKVLE